MIWPSALLYPVKKMDYFCNRKPEIRNVCVAVKGHCLQDMKIVHHHVNGCFDSLISGLQSVNPSRAEKQFLYCLAIAKDLCLSILCFVCRYLQKALNKLDKLLDVSHCLFKISRRSILDEIDLVMWIMNLFLKLCYPST